MIYQIWSRIYSFSELSKIPNEIFVDFSIIPFEASHVFPCIFQHSLELNFQVHGHDMKSQPHGDHLVARFHTRIARVRRESSEAWEDCAI